MHVTHDNESDDLFRTSVVLSRSDLQKLKVVEAIEEKGRDELIRELIAKRVSTVNLAKAAA